MNKTDIADKKQQNLYKNFPSTHFLSNPKNTHNVLLWSTFFRRNLHRLAMDYLGIKLHPFQQLTLYLMGICRMVVIIAARAASKSFMIALYSCCRAITRPYTKIVLGSATRKQSKLIISEKIVNELMEMSPPLRKEIRKIKDSQNETVVYFKNGSNIRVFTANKYAKGLRSQVAVREECMLIDQDVDEDVISPFQTIRQTPYRMLPEYNSVEDLKEEPVDIYISSSWYDGVWIWDKVVDPTFKDMLLDKDVCVLAFDESVTLKHNIRTQYQMQKEKRKLDPMTFAIEYLNLRPKQNSSAFFTYNLLIGCQSLKSVFYPRRNEDVRAGIKNKYFIPKQPGEIRIIACDFAFVAGNINDNSAYVCIRAIPEASTFTDAENSLEIKTGYRREFSYIETVKGGDTTAQAIRIRQLYEDFDADYFILDARNGGSQIVINLGKVLYDNDRKKEYAPLKCMNNETYAEMVRNPYAKECIYVFNATQQLNSDIAFGFRRNLSEKKIHLLVNLNTGIDEILNGNEEYTLSEDDDYRFLFERPFVETQAMITEASELMYERNPQTGIVKVFEKGFNTKDRYVACAMGSYLVDLLERDTVSASSDYDYVTFIN